MYTPEHEFPMSAWIYTPLSMCFNEYKNVHTPSSTWRLIFIPQLNRYFDTKNYRKRPLGG